MSTIEWTEKTWNPTRGCSVVSPGCTNCYAMRQAHRFSGPGKPYDGLTKMTGAGPQWSGRVVLAPAHILEAPLHRRTPSTYFVNSMSDLFHEELSNEAIAAVFGVMAACPQHTFQVLTKRAERMREWFTWIQHFDQDATTQCLVFAGATWGRDAFPGAAWRWPLPNVWLGVSVEDQRRAEERIPHLVSTPAALRFLSCEPLLGPVDLRRVFDGPPKGGQLCRDHGLGWVIVGGESGNGARPMDLAWARRIVEDCKRAHVPVFVKQLGREPMRDRWSDGDWARLPLANRKGNDPTEWPADLRVREMPRGQA